MTLVRALIFLFVTACATATPYQPANYYGRGYRDQKLDNTKYRVSFQGNRMTERETVESYLFYRAAELTLEQGFIFFSMIDMNTDRKTRFEAISPVNFGFYTQEQRRFPYFIYGNGFQQPQGGMMENTEYEAVAFIKLAKVVPEGSQAAYYKAIEVIDNLKPQVSPVPKK